VERLFLDANVLFSAAYCIRSGLLALWELDNVKLISSGYALEEARRNLSDDAQKERLAVLARSLELFQETPDATFEDVLLPDKDIPILSAAVAAKATHLITGDVKHFGPHFGRKICGILITPPADYLNKHKSQRW
jgi:uncharacterized protein